MSTDAGGKSALSDALGSAWRLSVDLSERDMQALREWGAALVAAERERCAKLCELKSWEWNHSAGHPTEALQSAANEIRGA